MKFSIIIPCYNDGIFALKAIDSCLSQTQEKNLFFEIEILLIDDGSKNNSFDLLHEKYKFNEKVKLFKKCNGGLSSARNYGIINATGDYIIFLDSDDLLGPTFIDSAASSIKNIPSDKKLTITFTPFKYFAEDFIYKDKVNSKINFCPPILGNLKFINKILISNGNCFPVSSCVISKDLIIATGFFDENLKSHEDWDYWIRALKHCTHISHIKNNEKSATLIRVREGMMSNAQTMKSSKIEIYNKYRNEFPFNIYSTSIGRYSMLIFRRMYEKIQKNIFCKRKNLTRRM